MNYKESLTNILNALGNVETKGESTLILADCRRMLAQTISSMPDKKPDKSNVKKEDKPEK